MIFGSVSWRSHYLSVRTMSPVLGTSEVHSVSTRAIPATPNLVRGNAPGVHEFKLIGIAFFGITAAGQQFA